MPLQNSGAISLNEIHIEAGGGSGTQVSINESDVRGLIGKSSGSQMAFSEWYGASNVIAPAVGWTDVLGTLTASGHGQAQPSVFNIWYKRTIFAYTITQSELAAVGITENDVITGIKWYMTNAPQVRPYPNYQIALCNMSSSATVNTNPTYSSNRTSFSNVISQQNWDVGSSINLFKGFSLGNFSHFTYTGGAIGVIVAWGAVPNYNQSGICATSSVGSNKSWYSWTDSSGTWQTTNTASGSVSYRPRTSFRINSGTGYVYKPRFHTTTTSQVFMGSYGSMTKDLYQDTSGHNFQSYAHPDTTGLSLGAGSYYFSDLGNDVYDNWGYFHLSMPGGHYVRLDLSGGNQADGVFTEREQTYIYTTPNPTFYIKFGHPVANGWMLHVVCKNLPNQQFRLVCGGNMGSDSSTYNRHYSFTGNMNSGGSRMIVARENSDNAYYTSNEQVRWWMIPLKGDNTNFNNNDIGAGTSGDNHYIWSSMLTGGVTMYMSKGNSISPSHEWVLQDLDGESGTI